MKVQPSMSGMERSSRISCGVPFSRRMRRASPPSAATATSSPSRFQQEAHCLPRADVVLDQKHLLIDRLFQGVTPLLLPGEDAKGVPQAHGLQPWAAVVHIPESPTPKEGRAVSTEQPAGVETDPRFPSGPWTGFFLQRAIPGRHRMELRLTFHGGVMEGEGRDRVGAVPHPRPLRRRGRPLPLDQALPGQARRVLQGLQRGQRHLGRVGDTARDRPSLQRRVPHLAGGACPTRPDRT